MSEDDIQEAETEASEESEVETDETETDATQEEASTEADESDQEDDTDEDGEDSDGDDEKEGGDDDEEEIVLNFGGQSKAFKKGSVPDEIVNEVQDFVTKAQAAHTRRSQELAEDRKSVETSRETFQKLTQLQGDALDSFARGHAIRMELEQIKNAPLDQLWNSTDPQDRDRARRISDRKSSLESELQSVIGTVQKHESELSQAQVAEQDRLMDEGRKKADSLVKDFSDVHAPLVEKYVVETYGMTQEEAKTWPLNPVTAVMAHKSMLYDQMMEKAANPKPASKKTPKAPVTPMKSKGKAKKSFDLVKDADKMSSAEWLKRRNAELNSRERRPN